MKPRIQLVTTRNWFAPARLGMALAGAGFEVHAVCPPGHPISKAKAVLKTYHYNGLMPIRSLLSAARQTRPDVVIPCDDLATSQLHDIYNLRSSGGGDQPLSRAILQYSLGDPASYVLVRERHRSMCMAKGLGVRVPATAVIRNESDLDNWLDQEGLPAVLKTDGSSGGVGVRIVNSAAEARSALGTLHQPPEAARVFKRAVFDNDTSLMIPWMERSKPLISVQRYISGRDACSATACWKGELLASIDVEVLAASKTRGPSSVVRLIDHPEMQSAVRKIVSHLRLSGFFGFDFMIEDRTGFAYLIEINPRATQTAHLPFGPGRDLAAGFYSAVTQTPVRPRPRVASEDVIALFPQEWQHNPASGYLTSAYHDVPWEEPELLRACIQSREGDRKLLSSENLSKLSGRLRAGWRQAG